MKIWLDDIRPAPDNWIWLKNSLEFSKYEILNGFVNGEVEAISFDHDLGEDSHSGYWCVCVLEELVYSARMYKRDLPEFTIHSANPVGRRNIQRAIDNIYRLAL